MSESDSVQTQGEEGNTKTSSRSRGWCFTWNNYAESDRVAMAEWMTQQTQCYIMGKEVGESGTPHLQGYVYMKNQRTFTQMKKLWGKCHWEKAKGKPIDNRNYCSKDNDYVEGGWAKSPTDLAVDRAKKALDKYVDTEWKPWQRKVLDIVSGPTDDRSVWWVLDTKGGHGKSYLAKYLYLTYPTIIADGKKDNVFNQLKTKLDLGVEPKLVLLDIPRSGEGYMNYGVIEQLKNGLVYSGKYEGGDCVFEPPHVVVMANFEPRYEEFTEDRWHIIDLRDED